MSGPDTEAPEPLSARFLSGMATAGRMTAAAARGVGRTVAAAYRSVDPDVRRTVAEAPLLALTMLAGRHAVAALPDDGHAPVLFVHGLGGHPGNFFPMRSWFRFSGRRRTYAVALAAGAPLDALAAAFAADLAAIVAANALPDGAPVQVVAHSLGGLVVRLALADPAVAARVETLVTLGTPHAGTHLARFADTEATRSLRPDSDVLARLRRQLPWGGPPALPRLVAFWSRADVMLLPAETACVDGAANLELDGLTHNGYLLHPLAWRAAFDALA